MRGLENLQLGDVKGVEIRWGVMRPSGGYTVVIPRTSSFPFGTDTTDYCISVNFNNTFCVLH